MKMSQCLIVFFIVFSGFSYAETESRQQNAHQHGKAELAIAISKEDVIIELHSPAHNILGFEHQPKTEKQQQLLANAITRLKTTDNILIIPKSAQCKLKSVEVESPFSHKNDEIHHHEEEAHEEAHSEFEVIYQYQCGDNKHLTNVNLKPLFENFPGFEQLDVQWLSNNKQSAKTLSINNSHIDF